MSRSPALPSLDDVRTLPEHLAQEVPPEFIDENGHVNIGRYFEIGSMAAWLRLLELGVVAEDPQAAGRSYFTVEHRLNYLAELRLGERLSARTALVERTAKALRGVVFVVDETHGRIACVMDLAWVHVSMETRRASDIEPDAATVLDAEIAAHPWVPAVATGLSLRR